jgi:toxin CcdB
MQYDVCVNRGRNTSRAPYFLIMQRDAVDGLPTRIVVPILRIDADEFVTRVMVPVEIAGEKLTLSMPELFSMPAKQLGPKVANLADHHAEFILALDRLITG